MPTARPQRHPYRVGQLVHARLQGATRGFVVLNELAHQAPHARYERMPPRKSPVLHTGIAGAEHGSLLGYDSQHVACRQDQVFLAVVLDFGAAVLAVDDGVTLGHVQRDPLVAIFVPPAGADCDDGAFLRLLLGGVRNDQTRRGRGLGLVGLHENLVLEWLDLHLRHDWSPPLFGSGPGLPGPELAVGPGHAPEPSELPGDSAFVRALAPSSRVPTQGVVRMPPSTLYMRVLALKGAP